MVQFLLILGTPSPILGPRIRSVKHH